jgi:hypothetical protein
MKIKTLMWRAAALAAGALVAVAAFSGPPEGVPIKISYWGSGIETAVDSDGDPFGLKLSLSMAEASGSFGAVSAYITSEFAVDPSIECPTGYLPLRLFQSTSVVNFAAGDQLFGSVYDGEMCLDFDPFTGTGSGYYFGDAEGDYIGGTGRFAGATGTFYSTYTGYNLEPALTGFRSIAGEIEGRVILK